VKRRGWNKIQQDIRTNFHHAPCYTTQNTERTGFQRDDSILRVLFYPFLPIILPNHCLLVQTGQRNNQIERKKEKERGGEGEREGRGRRRMEGVRKEGRKEGRWERRRKERKIS
jgi:hypothetical protein